ncbi:hypothetical protein [Nostoc sp. ChiQUE01b]|uniref:hypothetical protein n=1 Tax=Nostoc sp. ChiQUE01b TaxID=3075376 RepID=UPI002AD24D9E|nr:hypothetical protein [Nostoc sp. ChiQUE01b]MDZ8264048.1 hypothetical protein [Nostoc sp. ChiQUE01b]
MIDFEPWDRLLRLYVDRQGRVNYIAWKTEQPQAIAFCNSGVCQNVLNRKTASL